MKNLVLVIVMAFFSISFSETTKEKPMSKVVNEALDFSLRQYLLMAEKYAGNDTILPRSFRNGEMTSSNSRWWCSGFFPGSLWYLYEYSKDKRVLDCARQYTARVEREKFTTNNHDVGFILYCSFGNGLRLTGDSTYKNVLLTGAKSLATRYNPKIGLIRSWDFNKDKWQYPVIIDNMMNLELLLWASKNSNDQSFNKIAVSHADKTMLHHYRKDYSCCHVVSYDTITGLPHTKQTFQGYSDGSSWSRGQAWGLYGYTTMYRETKDVRYLEQAQSIAIYLIDHPRMPKDYIPYWDFDAPDIPNALRDASAGALMASALIELSQYVGKSLSEKYLEVATKQIRTLASPEYTAGIGENGNFILKHSVGSLPGKSEVDTPLTYADYYYLEALLKYKKLVLDSHAQEVQRPAIWGIAKMTFLVSDFKVARDYYGKFLGFDEAFSYSSGLGKVISFKVNDRQFLEFVEDKDAKNKARLVSVSFETEDVEQMRQYLKSKDVAVPESTKTDGSGNEVILVHDQFGVPLEFIDMKPNSLHRKSKGKFLSERRISKRIHHAGLFCNEVLDDDPFYVGILGFKELWRYPEDHNQKVKMNYLHIPDCVENIEHYPADDINFNHPCFLVDDMQETIYTLKERKGNNPLGKPIVAKGKRWLLNMANEDGTKVEFTEAHAVR